MTAVRALAFGDLEQGSWGAGWIPDAASARVALGAGAAGAVSPATLEGALAGEDWRLRADGAELVVSPVGEPIPSGELEEQPQGFDQLCRVSGRFELAGEEHPVDCLGWRAQRELTIDKRGPGSFRQVSAWFEPDHGLALLALRPRSAKGQEQDVIAAAVIDPERPWAIFDPRLSTTYREDGRPVRAGLELWVQERSDAAEAEPPEPDEDGQGPGQSLRRAAGEALGAHADWTIDGLELHAELFRWHSHGLDGAGVYLLGTFE